MEDEMSLVGVWHLVKITSVEEGIESEWTSDTARGRFIFTEDGFCTVAMNRQTPLTPEVAYASDMQTALGSDGALSPTPVCVQATRFRPY